METTVFRNYYGAYNLRTKVIKLASPELIIFLHELAHAVDDHLHCIHGGQIPLQEVVAEFSAAVIGYLMGYKISLGNAKEYIKSYGFTELFKAFARVERIVSFVVERTSRSIEAGMSVKARLPSERALDNKVCRRWFDEM